MARPQTLLRGPSVGFPRCRPVLVVQVAHDKTIMSSGSVQAPPLHQSMLEELLARAAVDLVVRVEH